MKKITFLGIQMTYNDLQKALGLFNIIKFNSLHEKLDPNLHQTIQMIENPKLKDGQVGFVQQEGYMIDKDQLLRPAMVCVIKNPVKKDVNKGSNKEKWEVNGS